MKKILFIINDNLSSNARSLYEIKSLADTNNKITVLCDKYHPRIKFLKKKNIKIIPLNFKNNLVNKLLWFIFLIDFKWLEFLKINLNKFSFDVVHIQNNYLFKTVYKFFKSKKKNQKIILDIHDSLPESFISWNKEKHFLLRLLYLIFTNLRRLRKYEHWSVRKSTRTLVTTNESKNKITKLYSKYLKNKIHVIENLESVLNFQKKFKIKLKKGSNLRIIYFGSFAPHRGLETIINCAKLFADLKVEFYLIGALNTLYSKKISNYKSKNLKILKRIDLKNLKKFTNSMSIGIVPHIKNMHTDTTIPYKLSQYMSLGIPQIVSNCKPLVQTLKESKSGLIYKSGNHLDLAKKIKIIQKLNLQKLKSNSLKYFKKNNWELIVHKNILNIYEEI